MQAFVNTHPGSDKVQEANQIIESAGQAGTEGLSAAQLYFDLAILRLPALR